MLLIWIPLGIIIISSAILTVIAVRKIPYLRALDVLNLPKAKVQELKKTLVAKRLSRVGERWSGTVRAVLSPLVVLSKAGFQAVKNEVVNLEERYQRLKRESTGPKGMNPEALKKLIDESETLMKEGRYGEAEKKFIEILNHDPKNFTVYEDLGGMYMMTKNLDQAEETYQFILKARPNDASVLTSLGEIELQRGKATEAATYFGRAVKKRSNNPKYLDFLIEASIQAGEAMEARRALEKLRNTNPENHKLAEFEERITVLEERNTRPIKKEKE